MARVHRNYLFDLVVTLALSPCSRPVFPLVTSAESASAASVARGNASTMLLPTSLRPIRPGRLFPAFATITALLLCHFYIFSSRQPAQIVEALTEVLTSAETANSTLGVRTTEMRLHIN